MNSKPKIAVIGLKGIPAFGGAAAVGENIVRQLKDNFEFTVLSTSSHTQENSGLIHGIKQIVFRNHGKKSLNTLIYYWKCLFHCLFHHYDLIHLHHAESGFITPMLRLKYKVIVTFHGIYNYEDPKFTGTHNWFFRFSEKLNVAFASEVISVSAPDKDYVRKKYGREVMYIPNGINVSQEEETAKREKTGHGYILFAAGRIYQIKGLHLLLNAAKKIGLKHKIKVAGDLGQVAEYKKEIELLGSGLDIEYLGMIRDKDQLMQIVSDASLFVFPSLTEAMSMMLLEVVSMKTPVIASDIPSNMAVFNDDEVLFFQSNDANDLAEKLQYAINKPGVMSDMAERAYSKTARKYTWPIIADQYRDVFMKFLKKFK